MQLVGILQFFLQTYPHPPLSKRIVKSSNPAVQYASSGPRGSYRKWDDDSMHGAMLLVTRGEPLRKAAEAYRIPVSTLHDHITGKVHLGARSGPDPYLTTEEEEEVASFFD